MLVLSPIKKCKPMLRSGVLWLLLLTANLFSVRLQAQQMGYSFTSASGTYTAITGGTQASSGSGMDDATFSVTLPFSFNFYGTSYTQVYLSENGYVSFGSTNPGTSTRSAISSTNTGFALAAAFSGDLQGISATSELRYITTGSAPNRVFTAQWSNQQFYLASSQSFNFQIQLYEATNQVKFQYGTVTNTGSSSTAQVGLRGSTNATYQNRTSTTNWSSTTAGTTNTDAITINSTVSPASGLTYTWTPMPMTYTSATTAQASTAPVVSGATNQVILQVQVVTGGGFLPILNVSQLNFSTNGSTNASNIANAKVYYTGTSSTFAATTQFGSTATSPSGAFSVTGSQDLAIGTNYFWLTYDIVASPIIGNVLDAECSQITVSSTGYTPTVTAPAGTRTISNPLNGTYTVGSGGNYSTLTAAVSALNTSGVSGPVVFSLTDAAYSTNETFPIVITTFSGSSNTNTVTFKPSSANIPVITGNAASLFQLSGADNIVFDGSAYGNNSREMTFRNQSTGTSAIFHLASQGTGAGARNITIKNCNIYGGSSTATGVMGIYAGGTAISTSSTGADNDALTISNNSFSSCYYAIQALGVASTGMLDTVLITNNTIGDPNPANTVTYRGISLQNATLSTISGNTIGNMRQTSGVSTNPAAIELGGTITLSNITGNTIFNVQNPSSGGWGAYGINIAGTPTTVNIINNSISGISTMNYSTSSTTYNAFGIRITVAGTFNIYYNSVNLSGAVPNIGSSPHFSACLLAIAGTTLDLRNNNFANTQTGLTGAKSYSIYSTIAATAYASTTNRNNYYTAGANGILGYLAADITTLTAWQTAMGTKDANSISANPLFNNVTNLKLRSGSPLLNAGGVISSATTDLTGTTRNASTPTIGAYEAAGELEPPVISFTPLSNSVSTTSRTTSGFLTAFDSSGIASGTGIKPRLYFKRSTNANAYTGNTNADNGWKYVEANNTSSPFDFTINYALLYGGSVNPGDQIQYFVVVQDSASTPNVTLGNSNFVRTAPTSVALAAASFPIYGYNTYSIAQQYSGTINVGTGQTFTSLTNTGGLFDALNNGAISSNLTVNITSDLSESGTVALSPISEIGTGNYIVTIQPGSASLKTISSVYAGAFIRLAGADRIVFDGRSSGSGNYLTFANSQSSGSQGAIQLISLGANQGAKSITVRNCNFILNTAASSVALCTGGSTINSAGADNDSLTIRDNYIRSASIGFLVNSTTGSETDVLTILNNTLDTTTVNGISLTGVRQFDISYNAIKNIIGTSATAPYGIVLSSNVRNGNITNNNLNNITSINQNAFGISIGTNDSNINITRNTITKVIHNGTSGWGGKGIDVNTGLTASGILIMNNMLANIGGDGYSTIGSDANVGIRINGTTGGVKVYHNSVNMYGSYSRSSATADLSAAFAAVGSTLTGIDVQNNLFRNSIVNTAGVQTSYSIYMGSTTGTNLILRRNNYVYGGSQGALGSAGATKTDLAAWKLTMTSDSLSVNRAVSFIDSTSNLRLAGSSIGDLYLRTDRINSTDRDIDSTLRSAITYSGAHQASVFTNLAVNAGADANVCSGASVTIGSASIVQSAGLPTYRYSWSPGGATTPNPSVSPSSNTTYIVTVTDTMYFTGMDTVAVTVVSAPTITLGTISSVNTASTSFSIPYTATTGSPNQYSIATGSPTAMSGFTPVTNATLGSSPITVTIPASAAGTYNFNLTVRNSTTGCSSTVPFTLTVNTIPPISGNTISSAQTICSGSTPASLTGSTPTGGTGSYTYQWLSSTTSATSGYAAATGTNNAQNYSPSSISVNTWFRRRVTSATVNDTSTAVLITVNSAVTTNTISSAQTICTGGTPNALTGSTPGGGNGSTYTYSWISSTTSSTAGFTAASGTNNANGYSPSALTANTWYKRIVASGACNADTSAAVAITVNAVPTITLGTVAGVVTTSTGFTIPYTATTGSPVQYSIATVSPNPLPGFTAVNNATLGSSPISVTIPASAVGTYNFTITVKNSNIGCVSTAVPFTLTISNIAISGNTISGTQMVCNGGTATALTGSTPTGGSGTYSYQWISSTSGSGSGYSNASGTSTQINYSPGVMTQNSWFKRVVVSGTSRDTSSFVYLAIGDTTKPVARARNLVRYLNSSGSLTLTTAEVDSSSSDNCGTPTLSLSKSSFACNNTGINTIRLIATDALGNKDSMNSIITVIDTIKPVITASGNPVVYLSAAGSANLSTSLFGASATDNCSIQSLSVTPTTVSCGDLGIKSVTLTATDVNGNISNQTATVVVLDPINPVARPKARVQVYLSANGQAAINPSLLDSASSDNCSITSRVLSQSVFTCSNVGNNTVLFTVQDQSGNSNSANVTVQVLDTISPVATVSNQVLYLSASGTATITAAQVNNNSTDNCGVQSFSISKGTFTCSDLGNSSINFTVSDINGNNKTVPVQIQVLDTIRPIVRPKALVQVYLDATGSGSLSVTQADSATTDNCSLNTRSLSMSSFNCTNLGINTVTLSATDQTGNVGSRAFTVQVLDTIRPLLTTRSATVYLGSNGSGSLTAGQVILSSSDNCTSNLNATLNTSTFNCSQLGNNTVNVTVSDASGNFRTLSASVTVLDTIKPVAIGQNRTIYLNASGIASITAAQVNNGSTDNCTIQSMAISKTNFTSADLGANTITYTVTDNSNNSQSTNVVVTVVDTVRPVVIGQNRTIYLNNSGTASITASQVNNGSSDNAGSVSLTLNKSQFSCNERGANQVLLTALDASNNSSSVAVTVTVLDTIKPIVNAQNLTVYLNGIGLASITAEQINNGSTDNCSIQSMNISKNQFTCSNTGSNTVTLTITDESGNSNSSNVTITVVDTLKPNVVINNNLNLYLDATGNGSLTAASVNNGSTDNCGITAISLSKSAFTGSDLGLNVITFTAKDASNNSSSVNVNINVIDTIRPVLRWKNPTLYLDASGQASLTVLDADNGTTDNVLLSQLTLNKTHFNCQNTGANLIELTAQDVSGNRSTTLVTVTVLDTVSPQITSFPVNLVIGYCNRSFNYPQPAANDNCSNVLVKQVSGLPSGAKFPVGSTTNVYTFTDASGNVVTRSFTVTVIQNTIPDTFPNIQICSSAQPFDLTRGHDSVTFAGSGVSADGKTFDPALAGFGNNRVQVIYTDPLGCEITGTFTVTVYRSPEKPVIDRMNANVLQVNQVYDYYQWYRNNEPIAGATGRSYTMTKAGIYTVKVGTNQGCTSESDPVYVGVPSGISGTAANQLQISIFPNPSTGRVEIDLDLRSNEPVHIEITDGTGRLVRDLVTKNFLNEFDLSDVAAGTYYVRVTQGNYQNIKPLVIAR